MTSEVKRQRLDVPSLNLPSDVKSSIQQYQSITDKTKMCYLNREWLEHGARYPHSLSYSNSEWLVIDPRDLSRPAEKLIERFTNLLKSSLNFTIYQLTALQIEAIGKYRSWKQPQERPQYSFQPTFSLDEAREDQIGKLQRIIHSNSQKRLEIAAKITLKLPSNLGNLSYKTVVDALNHLQLSEQSHQLFTYHQSCLDKLAQDHDDKLGDPAPLTKEQQLAFNSECFWLEIAKEIAAPNFSERAEKIKNHIFYVTLEYPFAKRVFIDFVKKHCRLTAPVTAPDQKSTYIKNIFLLLSPPKTEEEIQKRRAELYKERFEKTLPQKTIDILTNEGIEFDPKKVEQQLIYRNLQTHELAPDELEKVIEVMKAYEEPKDIVLDPDSWEVALDFFSPIFELDLAQICNDEALLKHIVNMLTKIPLLEEPSYELTIKTCKVFNLFLAFENFNNLLEKDESLRNGLMRRFSNATIILGHCYEGKPNYRSSYHCAHPGHRSFCKDAINHIISNALLADSFLSNLASSDDSTLNVIVKDKNAVEWLCSLLNQRQRELSEIHTPSFRLLKKMALKEQLWKTVVGWEKFFLAKKLLSIPFSKLDSNERTQYLEILKPFLFHPRRNLNYFINPQFRDRILNKLATVFYSAENIISCDTPKLLRTFLSKMHQLFVFEYAENCLNYDSVRVSKSIEMLLTTINKLTASNPIDGVAFRKFCSVLIAILTKEQVENNLLQPGENNEKLKEIFSKINSVSVRSTHKKSFSVRLATLVCCQYEDLHHIQEQKPVDRKKFTTLYSALCEDPNTTRLLGEDLSTISLYLSALSSFLKKRLFPLSDEEKEISKKMVANIPPRTSGHWHQQIQLMYNSVKTTLDSSS